MSTRAMSTVTSLHSLARKVGRYSRGVNTTGRQSFRAYTAFRQPNASLQQLQMFPEYPTAVEHESTGNYAKAIPLYQRFHEVISSAMGNSSSLAIELTYNTALLQKQSGNYDRAIQTVNASIAHANAKVDKVRLHELLAMCHLLKGDFDKAVEVASITVDICEAHEEHNGNNDVDDAEELALFSPSYSILGVSSLFHGDLDSAETYLQLAARWAQPNVTQHQVAALSNLGLLSIYKINTSGFPCSSEHAELQAGLPALRRATTTTAAGVNRKHLLEDPLVKEAVAYWQGALDIVNEANNAKVASQAAAMCGVPANAAPDMTGLGGKARMVTTSVAESSADSKNSDNKGDTDAAKAKNLLLEPEIMTAYVSVLCNFAELYELTGELNHKEEYLSAALTVIKNYEAQLQTTTNTSADRSNSDKCKTSFPLSQVLHKPLLGRVLTLVAHRELSVGQTVVAEGLYRSAIENLSSPAALHDPRYQHELAIAQGGYGLLLTRWDKRASAGQDLLKQSDDLLSKVPVARLPRDNAEGANDSGSEGDIVIPLTGMLQLPL